MGKFVDKLATMQSFRKRKAISKEQIKNAEVSLELEFSKEYKDYLAECGVASIYGHEFTGICNSARLDVVTVTWEERNNNQKIPNDLYVVEQIDIDGIVIWQSKSGVIYQSQPNMKPVQICDSLYEYIEQF